MNNIDFELRGEHIALDALLKATGVVGSGGMAKILIQDGQVQVDGKPETRRAAKVRAGQVIVSGSTRIRVTSATTPS